MREKKEFYSKDSDQILDVYNNLKRVLKIWQEKFPEYSYTIDIKYIEKKKVYKIELNVFGPDQENDKENSRRKQPTFSGS